VTGEQVLKKLHNPTFMGVKLHRPYTIECVFILMVYSLYNYVRELLNVSTYLEYYRIESIKNSPAKKGGP
jgi:hypothetical protein